MSHLVSPSGIGVVLLAATCISLSNVLSPLVYDSGTNAITLLVLRYIVFLLICILWLRLQSISLGISRSERLTCYGAGLAYTAGSGALLGAFAHLPVSLSILIFFTFPFITLVLESILDRQLPSLLRLGCVLAAFFGVMLALRADADNISLIGLGLACTAAVGVAIAFTWTARALKNVDPVVMTFHMSVAGLVFAASIAIVSGNFQFGAPKLFDFILLLAAILSFGIAYLAMFLGVRVIGASSAAMFMNLEPVFTIFLALWILHETLTSTQFSGAALIVSSVLLAQWFSQRHSVS